MGEESVHVARIVPLTEFVSGSLGFLLFRYWFFQLWYVCLHGNGNIIVIVRSTIGRGRWSAAPILWSGSLAERNSSEVCPSNCHHRLCYSSSSLVSDHSSDHIQRQRATRVRTRITLRFPIVAFPRAAHPCGALFVRTFAAARHREQCSSSREWKGLNKTIRPVSGVINITIIYLQYTCGDGDVVIVSG